MFKHYSFLILILAIIGCEKVDTAAEKQPVIIDETLVGEDISVSSILDNPIIYESLNFSVTIDNSALEVSKIDVLIGAEILATVEGSKELEINLNPEDFPAGDTILTLKVTDSNKKTTHHEYPISIHRILLEIDLPEGFFLPSNSEFHFFASSIAGDLLAAKQIDNTPQTFKLTTPTEIDQNTPYMLTYVARYMVDSFNQTNLFTIKDLTRANLPILRPKSPFRYGASVRNEYSSNGFSNDDVINIGTIFSSFGYNVGYYSNTQNFLLDEITMDNSDSNIRDYYVPVFNLSQNDHAYIWLKKEDLSSDFILDANNLIRDGIESRNIDASYNDGAGDGRYGHLTILGYNSEQDFNDGIFHYLWQKYHGIDAAFPTYNSVSYFFNNTFAKYSHIFQWEDYYTKRIGAPLNSYNIPTWSFDYVHNGKEIDLTKNGDGHTVGRVFLSNLNDEDIVDGKRTRYNWSFLFDSQDTDKIILPELPEDLETSEFGSIHASNALLVERVLLHSYEGISDYTDYLDRVIKTNENILTITPNVQAKFINRRGNQWVIESDNFFY